jgi:predicted phosphodiesterase
MKIGIISDIHDNLANLEKCLKWCAENKIEKIICCGDITNSETLSVLAHYESPLKGGLLDPETSGVARFPSREGCRRRGGLSEPACPERSRGGRVYLIRGNMEIYKEEELAAYPNIVNGGRAAVWEIGGKIIGACHEPFLIKEVFAKNSPPIEGAGEGFSGVNSPPSGRGVPPRRDGVGFQDNIDIIFYGHTHKPWIEDVVGNIPTLPGYGHPSRGGELKIVNSGTLGGVFARATFAVYDTEKSEPELKILDLL